MDYQDYMKSEGDKGKKKDRVPNKPKGKAVTDYVVKQALAAQSDSSSESNNSEKPEDTSCWLKKMMKQFTTFSLLSWQNLMMVRMMTILLNS